MDLDLDGKRAIITGASKGIGASCAATLASEGATVALIARTARDLDTTVDAINVGGQGQAISIVGDVSNASGVHAAFGAAMETLGGVDILVNNAGSSKWGTIESCTDDDWLESYELKLMGFVRAMRIVLPSMRAQRFGRIVNILGVGGIQAGAGYVLGCFNTALVHVTRATAEHVAADGVTVNAVHPGPTKTDRINEILVRRAGESGVDAGVIEQQMAATIPVGRLGQPDDIARTVAFLCSPRAEWTTGGQLLVDGGSARGLV